VILVLVAIAEAGIIILGLTRIQRMQETPVGKPDNASHPYGERTRWEG